MEPCVEPVQHWYLWHPPIGIWIGIAAITGILIPFFKDFGKVKSPEKAAWTLLMCLFLGLEVRTLYLDRDQHDSEQALARCQQLQSFEAIADKLDDAIKASQGQFNSTMTAFSDEAKKRQTEFGRTLEEFHQSHERSEREFQGLIAHEEKLAESTSGVLVPGSEPDPKTPWCLAPSRAKYKDSFFLVLGNSASSFDDFPVTPISSRSSGKILELVRAPDGNVSVVMDIRDITGRIVARLGGDGYIVGSRMSINRPNPSTLVVVDEFGIEALRISYVNKHVITMDGYMNVGRNNLPVKLEWPGLQNSCAIGGGRGGGIGIQVE